ncbi:MAG: gliding motility-associated C-terminal domain-containing protein [Bacteroidales bacterium]|nr:gliding motility-associated C-terminal domain-containing protein [Bacteroidales bacterium]
MKLLYTLITISALTAAVPLKAQKPELSTDTKTACTDKSVVTVKVDKVHTPFKYITVKFGDGKYSYITDMDKELKHIYLEEGVKKITYQTFYEDKDPDEEETLETVTVGITPELSLYDDAKSAKLVANSSNATAFTWYVIDRKGSETELQTKDSELNYLESGEYKVVVTSKDGCTNEDTKTVSYQKNQLADFSSIIVVNNIITPNNDGINDVLYIEDLDGYDEPCEVKVFNKHGKAVYENPNYSNTDGFKGLDEKGNDLFAGTYYYVIKSKGRRGVSGFVDIIRQ